MQDLTGRPGARNLYPYYVKWKFLTLFSKMTPFYLTDRKTLKLFNGLVVGFEPKGMPGRMCNIVC